MAIIGTKVRIQKKGAMTMPVIAPKTKLPLVWPSVAFVYARWYKCQPCMFLCDTRPLWGCVAFFLLNYVVIFAGVLLFLYLCARQPQGLWIETIVQLRTIAKRQENLHVA